jgi:Zn-dependent protease
MFSGNPQELILFFAARLLVLLIAGPVHEMAHAWSAYRLGDRTSYDYGRLSLNPLNHLDPLGTIMILLGGFGWFKPVPVNPYALRAAPNIRLGMALVSAAGPASNLLLAVGAAVLWRLGLRDAPVMVATVVYIFIYLNIALALFNMIPLPPLDGSKVLMGIAPYEWAEKLAYLEQYGLYILMAIIALPMITGLNILGWLIGGPIDLLMAILIGSW